MYSKPFGSLFGENIENNEQKPGFLQQNDAPKSNLIKEMPAKPTGTAAPTVGNKNDLLSRETEAAKKAPVIKPGETAVLKTSDLESPGTSELDLALAVYDENKHSFLNKRIERKINQVEKNIKSAVIYHTVLLQYKEISPNEKKKLITWILKYKNAIKKFGTARQLKRKTEALKNDIALLNVDITHWESLKKLKKAGKLKVKKTLKGISSLKKKSESKELPQITGGKISEHIKQIENKGIQEVRKQKEQDSIQTLGESAYGVPGASNLLINSVVKENLPPVSKTQPLPKMVVPSMYNLPAGERQRIESILTKKDSLPELIPESTEHKAERRWGNSKQLQWKIGQKKLELESLLKTYKSIIDKINIQIEAIKEMNPENGTTITASLGILTEGKPERFLVAADLQESIETSFKRLTTGQLGDAEVAITINEENPEQQADKFLEEASAEFKIANQQLETHKHALAVVAADVEEKPMPPPLLIPKPPSEIQDKKPSKSANINVTYILIALVAVWLLIQVVK